MLPLIDKPMVLSMETKQQGQSLNEDRTQLSLWSCAHLNRLEELARRSGGVCTGPRTGARTGVKTGPRAPITSRTALPTFLVCPMPSLVRSDSNAQASQQLCKSDHSCLKPEIFLIMFAL